MQQKDDFYSSEFYKILESNKTFELFSTSKAKGDLKDRFPEINHLFDVPERKNFHPEGNTGKHTLLVLKELSDASPMIKYAALVHDFGKVATFEKQIKEHEQKNLAFEKENLTKHFGHAEAGVPLVKAFSEKMGVPEEWNDFAELVCKNHMKMHDIGKMKDSKLFEINQEIPDKFFEPLMQCCMADTLGRDISKEEKDKIREEAQANYEKMKEVRGFMAENKDLTKETFANVYKTKSQSR